MLPGAATEDLTRAGSTPADPPSIPARDCQGGASISAIGEIRRPVAAPREVDRSAPHLACDLADSLEIRHSGIPGRPRLAIDFGLDIAAAGRSQPAAIRSAGRMDNGAGRPALTLPARCGAAPPDRRIGYHVTKWVMV